MAAALAAVAHAQVLAGGNNAIATSLIPGTITSGTVLDVRGAVSQDGRYVTMSVYPTSSTLDGIDTFIVSNPLGNPNVMGAGGMGGGVVPIPGIMHANSVQRVPFRPAQVGKVTFVDSDKPLLTAHVAPMDLKQTSLKDAVRKLADTSKENLVLGLRGFAQADVDTDAPHDFDFPAGTMKDALLAMTHTAMPDTDVVITSEDKVITVVTQTQADQVLVTKTYYLEDLLAAIPRFVPPGTNLNDLGKPQWNLIKPNPMSPDANPDISPSAAQSKAPISATARPASAPPTASTTSPANPKSPVPQQGGTTAAASATSGSINIVELISDTVRPEIWKNHGGKAEIYALGEYVTIKAPAYVHALLDGPKVYNPNKAPTYIQY